MKCLMKERREGTRKKKKCCFFFLSGTQINQRGTSQRKEAFLRTDCKGSHLVFFEYSPNLSSGISVKRKAASSGMR